MCDRESTQPEMHLVLHLREPLLRILGAELGCLPVPDARLCRIGRDASRIRRSQHRRIISPRQHQGGAGFLRICCPLEQQTGGCDVADGQQAFRSLEQGCEFVGI